MAKPLTVAKMMSFVADEGWAITVQPHGNRFHVTVWNGRRTARVDASHYSFGGALHRALRLAYQAQQDAQEQRERDRQPGPTLPSPELLAIVMETASEVVA
jgi:hypothetical protein